MFPISETLHFSFFSSGLSANIFDIFKPALLEAVIGGDKTWYKNSSLHHSWSMNLVCYHQWYHRFWSSWHVQCAM